MKLSTKIALISGLGSLALVGTGFAAWTFTNTVTDSASGEAKVTCAIGADNVKVYNGSTEIETLYIILDAPTTGTSTRKAGAGIFFSSKADGSDEITELTLKGTIVHNEEHLHFGDDEEKVEFKVTENDQLETTGYVSFTEGSLADDVQDVTDETVYEATYTLPTYEYVAANIPTTVAEVDAMKTAFTGKTLALNFTFGIQA